MIGQNVFYGKNFKIFNLGGANGDLFYPFNSRG